ncbi:MAG: SPOR domain-containing protein [Methylococcales bacterium]
MEQRLKERLIGTAVITALAIIFLPMLIDEKDQGLDPQSPSAQIPPIPDKFNNKPQILSDTGVEDSRLFPVPDKQPLDPDNGSVSNSSSSQARLNQPASRDTKEPPAIRKSPSILNTEVIKKPTVARKAPPNMDNQLNSLLPTHNQLTGKTVAKPIVLGKTTQRTVPQLAPIPTPVDITPLGQPRKIEVAKLQPTVSPKPVKKALYSDLTGLWVVQAGVFKDKANAEALRKKLSENGYSAYLEAVNTELGQLIRVRAGRVPQEQAARQMVSTLNKRFGLKSIAFPETKWNSKRARK